MQAGKPGPGLVVIMDKACQGTEQQGPTAQSCFLGNWWKTSRWPWGTRWYSPGSEVRAGCPFLILLLHWPFSSSGSREKEQLCFGELVLKKEEKPLQMSYSIFPSTKGLLFPPIATSPSFLVVSQPHPSKLFVCPALEPRSTGPAIGHWCCSDTLQAQNKAWQKDFNSLPSTPDLLLQLLFCRTLEPRQEPARCREGKRMELLPLAP